MAGCTSKLGARRIIRGVLAGPGLSSMGGTERIRQFAREASDSTLRPITATCRSVLGMRSPDPAQGRVRLSQGRDNRTKIIRRPSPFAGCK
jgi:hypothetical protein